MEHRIGSAALVADGLHARTDGFTSLDVVAAHDIATATQHRLLHEVPRLVAATVHVGPHATGDHDHHAVLAHHPSALDPGAIDPAAAR